MINFRRFLKFSKGIFILILGLMLSFCAKDADAQSVNVNVTIVPPYSPYYADYSGSNASKVLLIVQNLTSTARSIKLTGQLEGDNGIKITTKSNYVPLQPINLNPNETKQLNGLALKDIFDLNTLNVYGIDKSRLIYTSRLPEGNYTFCIQAVDIQSNQVLSSAAPLGCTTISIAYPDAPVLVGPSVNESVPAIKPQSVVFNWINPGFTPVGTQYLLQIAEMPLVKSDPNQILNATSFPLINKNIITTSYTLNPSDPPLVVGKTYAWRVQAIDPSGKTIFKNDGKSGANVFTFGTVAQVEQTTIKNIEILLPNPSNFGKPIAVNNKFPLYIRWKLINRDEDKTSEKAIDYGYIDGINKPDEKTLRYNIEIKDKIKNTIVASQNGFDSFSFTDLGSGTFVDKRSYEFKIKAYRKKGVGELDLPGGFQSNAFSKSLMLSYNELAGESVTGSFIYQKIADTLAKPVMLTLKGKVQYHFENDQTYPIYGTIRLNKFFKTVDQSGQTIKDNISVASVNPQEPSSYLVKTSSDGRFTAKVTETVKALSGNLVAYYTIDFPTNNYYGEPDRTVELNGTGQEFNVGDFTSLVKSYQLNLHITKAYIQKAYMQKETKDVVRVREALNDLQVTIYRLSKDGGIPIYEGQGLPSNKSTLYRKLGKITGQVPEMVYKTSTDLTKINASATLPEAVVSFAKLICKGNTDDTYYINVFDPKTKAVIIDEPFAFQNTILIPGKKSNKNYDSFKAVGTASFEVEKTLNWTTEQAPIANIKGRLLYRYSDGVGGAMPMQNAKVHLEPFLVFTEQAGGKSYALPTSILNNQFVGIQVSGVNANGSDRSTKEDAKFYEYVDNVKKSLKPTTTTSDGSFNFVDIPIWDSVTVSKNLFSFVVKAPPIPTPPQTNPAATTLKDIWQSQYTGMGDANALKNQFINQVMADATNPLLDPFTQSPVKDALSQMGNGITTMAGGKVITAVSTVTTGGLSNSYDVSSSVKVKQVQAKKFTLLNGAFGFYDDNELLASRASGPAPLLPDYTVVKSSNVGSNGPCTLKMVYRLVVDDMDLFCSPDNNIEINPLQTLDVGSLYAFVRSAKVNISLYKKEKYDKKLGLDNEHITSVPIELRRSNHSGLLAEGRKFNNVLFEEKLPADPNLVDYGSSKKGGLTFNHVLQSRGYTFVPIFKDEANIASSYKPNTTNFYLHDADIDPTVFLGKTFLFNNEFVEPTFNQDTQLERDNPIVAGRLINSISGEGIGANKEKVTARINVGGIFYFLPIDSYGYFSFKSVALIGITAKISIQIDGYVTHDSTGKESPKEKWYYEINNMQLGQKVFNNLYYKPSASVTGHIVNAKGEPIPALYKITGSSFIQETESECVTKKIGNNSGSTGTTTFGGVKVNTTFTNTFISDCKQTFNAYIAPNKSAYIEIIPNDLKYFNETKSIAVSSKGNTEMGAIVLTTREHRIKFVVTNSSGEPVPNANIKLQEYTYVTDSKGIVYVNFMNIAEKNFVVKIVPPASSGYIGKEFSLTNLETPYFKEEKIILDKGFTISGVVTVNKIKLPNATVYVDNGIGASTIQTTTKPDGSYELKGLAGYGTKIKLTAYGPEINDGTIIGQTVTLAASQLKADFDLTKVDFEGDKLLGYHVNLTEASAMASGNYKLSGDLDVKQTSSDFKLADESKKIIFNKVEVKITADASGKKIAVPVGDILLDAKQLKTRFRQSYFADVLANGSQILVKKVTDNTGTFQAKVKITDNSFNYPSSFLKFDNTSFYFATKRNGVLNNTINLLATGSPNATTPKYYFSEANGGDIKFKLLEFDAHTSADSTYFIDGKIRLLPTITATKVSTLGDVITLKLPELKIDQNSVGTISSVSPLNLTMEKWTITIPQWKFSTDEGGIVALASSNNMIKTGVLNIPFKKFRLRNDALLISEVNVKKLSLGGIVDVNVAADVEPTFGLDPKIGDDLKAHYILRMLGKNGKEAGSIQPLPGIPQGIGITAATLVSSGEQYVDFSPNSKSVTAFNQIDFKPIMIESSQNDFTILGDVNLKIPRLQKFYGGFKYSNVNGKLESKPAFDEVKFDIGKGYVVFNSKTADFTDKFGNKISTAKTLADNVINLYGTVYEPNQLPEIPVLLNKTGDNISIKMVNTSTDLPKIAFGSNTNLIISSASTSVKNNDWDYLSFTGSLKQKDNTPIKGFADPNPLTFKVFGEVAYDSGTIKVSGANTPFGKMNMVFDWPEKRILGNLQMEKVDIGAASASGEAEIMIDKNGFYTFIAASVTVPVPIISPFKAGFLVGSYSSLPQNVVDRVTQFNHHKLPDCGKIDLTGFIVAGRKDLFEPYKLKIDLPPVIPLVSIGLVAECGVDALLQMNFANVPNFTLQAGAFGSVRVSMASITGTSASGGIEVDLTARLKYALKEQAKFDFCNSVKLNYEVKQSIFGLADISKSGSIAMAARGSLAVGGGQSANISFNLTSDTCADNNKCQTNK